MNSRTQAALIQVLQDLNALAMSTPGAGAAELADSCNEAINAIQNDSTVTETTD